MDLVSTALTLWVGEDGGPERIVFDGRRYRVTDSPTRLELDMAWVTHLPQIPLAWRFQGTDEDGDSVMFDIVQHGEEWRVLRTYK